MPTWCSDSGTLKLFRLRERDSQDSNLVLGSGTLNNFREMRLRLRQGAIGVGRWAIYPLMPGRGDTKHEKPRAGVEPAVPMALRPALVHVGPVEAARPRETRSLCM